MGFFWKIKTKTHSHYCDEDIDELLSIGAALSAQRDLEALLVRIVDKSRQILVADAASLYLAEGQHVDAPTHLVFKVAQNESVKLKLPEYTIPLNNKSLAGYVAQMKKPLNLSDVYDLPMYLPFSFNKEFDQSTGYRSQSLLSVPMTDHQDHLIGVVQVWNKKKSKTTKVTSHNYKNTVIPFHSMDLKLLMSLAAQAGIAIENARLYENINQLFEGFIRASVLAIESRDPTTSGHSERVAALTLNLVEQINHTNESPFENVFFSDKDIKEIKYAALLHDFGKIGVKETVLLKASELSLEERKAIESHVTHSYEFLRRIPWTPELRHIPYIAYTHHEKLDGTGYPRGVLAKDISLPSRIIAVADIFDALVASDRPYKKAIPVEQALTILREESISNKLDPDIVELLIHQQTHPVKLFT